jgi:hypothetical protein
MSDISSIPSRSERDWEEFEKELRTGYWKEGIPKDAVDWICDQVKECYLRSNRIITVKGPFPSAEAAIAECARQFHVVTNAMLGEITRLVGELYVAKFLAGKPAPAALTSPPRVRLQAIDGGKASACGSSGQGETRD